jgi:hypothetical protein
MMMHSSGVQPRSAADGSCPARPALVIEDLETTADHAVALATFCILAEPAVPGSARRAGRLDA